MYNKNPIITEPISNFSWSFKNQADAFVEDILKNKSLKVDHGKFQSLMKESKELAKKNWKGSGDSSVNEIWFGMKDKLGPTEF